MAGYRYRAFLSYSHADRRAAAWLHKRLEGYRFPKAVRKRHPDLPARLFPIFRDREELAAAHDLSAEIEAALADSQTLIVLCSTAAASSHWVNAEVEAFQRAGRNVDIVCVIIDGDTDAAPGAGGCFPPALLEARSGAIPLAADLRETADGRRLGLLKLIAGLSGLMTDQLVQRDLKRSRRRVMAVTGVASIVVLALSGLTMLAATARQEAEQRRQDAEGQIEFMLTDLRDRLETVGRIDVLQPVGERAATYYDGYPLSDHDDDALGRRARVFHLLGELQDKLGNAAEARAYFAQAYDATSGLLERDPDNVMRLFDHSQSAYWVGYGAWNARDFENAEVYLREYRDLITAWEPYADDRSLAVYELSATHTNLGAFFNAQGRHEDAVEAFSRARDILASAIADGLSDASMRHNLSNAEGWLASSYVEMGEYDASLRHRRAEISILESLIAAGAEPVWDYKSYNASAKRNLARLLLLDNQLEEAREAAQSAITQFDTLVMHDPENGEWGWLRARTLALLSVIHCRANDAVDEARVRQSFDSALGALGADPKPKAAEIYSSLKLGPSMKGCYYGK